MNSNFNASYKSYLSLCYNTLNKWWSRDEDYSDLEYKGNRFQTRRIITELEQKLREEILKDRVKNDVRENVFEVNFNRGKTITIGQNELQRLSFEFILMLDTLCLPLFSDQSFLLPAAIQNIMSTSLDTYWKSSFLIRANNKDVIERSFSRRSIAMSDLNMMTELFDNMWNCVKKINYKGFDERNAFFSQNNALNVLTRIAVYLDDDKFLKLMRYIIKIDLKDDNHSVNELNGMISRLSTRFNKKVAEALLDEVFLEADSRLCVASYFSQLDIKITESDKYYVNAIELIKKDKFERDNGIAQLLCLWRNCPDEKYKDQIMEGLWGNNIDVFPVSSFFYEMIWEELPHPDAVDFAELYRNVIYDGVVNHISDRDIFRYVNLFYLTSTISDMEYTKIDFDNMQLSQILRSIENQIENVSRAAIVFWDDGNEERLMRYISEFVTMIYVLKADEAAAYEILETIDRIILLIKSKGANGIAMNAIKQAMAENYTSALEVIKSAFWSNDEIAIAEASMGLQLISFIARKKKQDMTIILIKEAMIEIMGKLQYSDIKYVKSIWNLLQQPILKILSDDEDIQDRIAEVYRNCIRSYSYNGLKGDKYHFEAMYNCNKTLKSYIDKVCSKGITVGKSLTATIEYVKSLNMPELSSVWV